MRVDGGKFMIGLVSRLTDQKGMDLIDCVMEQICSEDVQFVIVWVPVISAMRICSDILSGSTRTEFLQVSVMTIRVHRIYAACDAFMPSLLSHAA